MSGRSPAWFRCLAPLALVVVLSGGCGGTARPNSGAGTPADGPALRALRSLADRPPSRSDRGTLIAPAPPGLESLAPPDPTPNDDATAAARRSRPLRELLPELSEPDRPPPEPDRIATPSERLGALRRYAAGREKLLRGDAPGALSDLRAAADLDPSSGEVWLALGDAQSLSGAKAESLAATERAVRLGAGGARPWEVLGREALANGDNARAAAMLSRAAGIPSGRRGSDPALQSLIGIELGQALDGLGYARAAIESLGASLRLLDSVQGTQRYRAELAAITRRKGGLWVRVGDLACRAGDFARARDAYQKAALLPAFGPGSERLLDRRVFAALRTGRPGEAALVVYEAVAASGGWAGEPDVALGAYLRSHGGREAPATLDGAFEALSRSPAPASSPALRGRLALIRAALLPARQASRVLQSQLLGLPADDRAATSLLWLAHSQSVEAAARQAVSLTARSPLRAETYARTLISLASLDQLLKSFEKAPANPARDLLSGRLLALVEAIDESLVRLDRASLAAAPGSVLRMGVELASAEVAGSAGRWDRVERSLAALQAD